MRRSVAIPYIDGRRTFRRVLVPVDITPASLFALRYAEGIARKFRGATYLLHVIETQPFAMGDGVSALMISDEEIMHEAKEQLGRLAKEQFSGDLRVKLLVRRGRPDWEIVHSAALVKADLVVLATHCRSLWGRFLLGSTARRVERHVPCPVLLVQGKDGESEATLWRRTSHQGQTRAFRNGFITPTVNQLQPSRS